jgi:alkanesulfonate monooxygenase SsuD/methylene tetrahydromethanopterin reductase-like flavin-dependent oxidoreductase (luciferase family)
VERLGKPKGGWIVRIGIAPYYHVSEVYPWETLLNEIRAEAKLAEEIGFSTIWFAEHHFWHDGWYTSAPNPLMLGMDIAMHCPKIRVGQCGTIITNWHPLRLAEDVAMLDHTTGGRVDFGIARGFDNRSTVQLNPLADRRTDERNYKLFGETLDLLLKAWTEDAFTHEGEFYRFPIRGWKDTYRAVVDASPRHFRPDGEYVAMSVRPKPVQKPHPPIWQMTDSNESHRYAAQRGIGAMSWGRSLEGLRQSWEQYRATARQVHGAGFDFRHKLSTMKVFYCAETMEQADRDARPGVNRLMDFSFEAMGLRAGRQSLLPSDAEVSDEDLQLDWFDFCLKHGCIWVGSPDAVFEQIERACTTLQADHIALFTNLFGLTFEQVMRSIELFGEMVMPRVQTLDRLAVG